MGKLLAFFKNNFQAILAFLLLGYQLWIPWSVGKLVTEDGPAHVYTAVVARELLLNPDSPYAAVYRFNPHVVPNWGTTIVLGLITGIFGVTHAEQILMSLALLAGFFAFGYAVRCISPESPRWTPLTNFLLQTSFLWLGFYNFYLAMALCPVAIGYSIRHAAAFTARRAAVFAALMTALFLTHLIPAVVAGVVVAIVAVWMNVASPVLFDAKPARARQVGIVALAFAPVLALFVWFAGASTVPVEVRPDAENALFEFPGKVFTTSSGWTGRQAALIAAALVMIVLAIGAMKRKDWRGPRGGLAMGTGAMFLMYVFVPDAGLGGNEAKIRFAWAVFVIGGLVLATMERWPALRAGFEMGTAVLLAMTLFSTQATLQKTNRAVDAYLGATAAIPAGAWIARLRYATPDVPARYGFAGIRRDPLFHLDSFIAAEERGMDLTDYQAPNNIFPIVFNDRVPEAARIGLWSFEKPRADSAMLLQYLQAALPAPIDYVIVMADASTPERGSAGYQALMAYLNREMRPVATSGGRPFVTVYRRNSLNAGIEK